MAKMFGVTKGIKRDEQRKLSSEIINTGIYKNYSSKEHTPKLGIKSSVMIVYAEKGKLAAWQALQEYNKKLSGEGFTLEMLEQWIGEYEKRQSQRMGRNSGCDR